MTKDHQHGTSVLSFCQLPGVVDKKGVVIERSFFEYNNTSHLTESSPEYLTQEEMVSLLEPFTTVPFSGERSIEAMREQWEGTYIGQALQQLPEGEPVSVEDLLKAFGKQYRELNTDESWVSVSYREVSRKIDGEHVTDRKLHLDWQGRASAYRVAADQAVGGLPVENFDRIQVKFASYMTRPNAFILYENRDERALYPPLYMQRLTVHQWQYRLIEQADDGTFIERAALPFLSIDIDHKVQETREVVVKPFVRVYIPEFRKENLVPAALLEESYPAACFTEKVCFPDTLPTISHRPPDIDQYILAPFPYDLVVPDDMPYSINEFAEDDDIKYES